MENYFRLKNFLKKTNDKNINLNNIQKSGKKKRKNEENNKITYLSVILFIAFIAPALT